MKLQILRRIKSGQRRRSIWWGYCWPEDYDNVYVTAPIGLNVLIAFGRWVYHWIEFRIARAFEDHMPVDVITLDDSIQTLHRMRSRMPLPRDELVETKDGITFIVNRDIVAIDVALAVLLRERNRVP